MSTMQTGKSLYQRLLEVQNELKAPREVDGRFGKARSAEQILEAAKPVCYKYGLYLFTTEIIHQVGERNYITSTATVVNVDNQDMHSASASAWENTASGGLDTSQVSGKTSSYAKKYALQNLFAIDDTKDADTKEHETQTAKAMDDQKTIVNTVNEVMSNTDTPSSKQLMEIKTKLIALKTEPDARDNVLSQIRTSKQASDLIQQLNERIAKRKELEG